MRTTAYYLSILLGCLIGIPVAIILVQQGSTIIADVTEYVTNLFRTANFRPGTGGFSDLVELLLIAAFVGWAINRFKRK